MLNGDDGDDNLYGDCGCDELYDEPNCMVKIFPQRRWIRFTLTSLFGVVAIIATLCAITLKRLEVYTDQVTLVARIAQVDPNKLWQYCDGEQPVSISLGSGRLAGIKVTPPEGWMSEVANFLGRPYRADITHILLVGQNLDYYEILDQLRQLPRLKCLALRDAHQRFLNPFVVLDIWKNSG